MVHGNSINEKDKTDQSAYQCISSKNSRLLLLFASNTIAYVTFGVAEVGQKKWFMLTKEMEMCRSNHIRNHQATCI